MPRSAHWSVGHWDSGKHGSHNSVKDKPAKRLGQFKYQWNVEVCPLSVCFRFLEPLNCPQWLFHRCVSVCVKCYRSRWAGGALFGLRCTNVRMNSWILACVIKHFELSIRLEKHYINAVHLPFKLFGHTCSLVLRNAMYFMHLFECWPNHRVCCV